MLGFCGSLLNVCLVPRKRSLVFGEQTGITSVVPLDYLQIHGTAMGTRMAPSYANLFLAKPTTHMVAVHRRHLHDMDTFCSSSDRSTLICLSIYKQNKCRKKIKCPERDSNPRHPDLMEGALTTELPRQPQWSESNVSCKGTSISRHLLPGLTDRELLLLILEMKLSTFLLQQLSMFRSFVLIIAVHYYFSGCNVFPYF